MLQTSGGIQLQLVHSSAVSLSHVSATVMAQGTSMVMIEASSGRKLCHTIRGLESNWSNSVVGFSLPTTKIPRTLCK